MGVGELRLLALVVSFLFCGLCFGDIIYLSGGGIIVGRIVDRDDECLVVRMESGARVTVSLERVLKVEEGEPLEIYKRKAQKLGMENADARYRLGLWCEKVRLKQQAREEFEKALLIDPNHREARLKLGLLKKSEEKPPSLKVSFKDLQTFVMGGRLTVVQREEMLKAAKLLYAKQRNTILSLAGLHLDNATKRIIAKWHKKWRRIRLQALEKVFLHNLTLTEYELTRVAHAYSCFRFASLRQLKRLLSMSQKEARKRLFLLEKAKRKNKVVMRALSLLGCKLKEEDESNFVAALLFAVCDPPQSLEVGKGLPPWQRQMVIEVISERIEKHNRGVKGLSKGERRLVSLLNDYRRMFGRLPLVVDERLCRAAKKHASEMRRLGYFGHISPVKGRTTPTERASLEGYKDGVGENLFSGDEPERAVKAWQNSSCHNRNMLSGWDPMLFESVKRNFIGSFWRALGVGIERATVALFGSETRVFYPSFPHR